jgi:hypothetical protein
MCTKMTNDMPKNANSKIYHEDGRVSFVWESYSFAPIAVVYVSSRSFTWYIAYTVAFYSMHGFVIHETASIGRTIHEVGRPI